MTITKIIVAISVSLLAVLAIATAQQAPPPKVAPAQRAGMEACEPTFTPIDYNRALPRLYVDEGLESLPRIAPKYMLLEQRRDARVGDVDYSLLVYKKDASLGAVTIEGAAVSGTKAWTFTARCSSSDAATNGLPAILKQVGALATPDQLGLVRAQSTLNDAWTTFVPANDISFILSMGRSSYSVQEQITVNYRIVNVSGAPLYVPRGYEATVCVDMTPHIQAWFENSAGKHFAPGYGASCSSGPGAPPTLTERMNKIAVLLRPGEHLDGAVRLDPTMFGLPPGAYRIEATMYGWSYEKFTDAEHMELAKMGNPFVRGEVPASLRVTLTP